MKIRLPHLYLCITLLCILLVNHAQATNNLPSFNIKAQTAVAIEATTGKILFGKKENQKIYPASLTKLMTLYVIFDQLKKNNFSLDSKVTISDNAYKHGNISTGSSTMFLLPHSKVTVEELIHGIATVSGNDASIAMAEYIAGSEAKFADYMNAYAAKLGLTGSHFVNATGWPNVNHYSTALDIAKLSRRLWLDFPNFYLYLSFKKYTYNKITQPNRNTLLFDSTLHVDGLKTGHTTQAGFSLAVSAVDDDNHRIIAVLDGLKSSAARASEGKKLINWVFSNMGTKVLYKKGELIKSIPVWNGTSLNLKIYAPYDIILYYNKGTESVSDYSAHLDYFDVLLPPINKGQIVATLYITNKKNPSDNYNYTFVSTQNIEAAGRVAKFIKAPYFFIRKLFL